MRLLLAAAAALLLAACASMGRPEGGPRDTTPPEFVRSVPAPGAVEVQGKRITLYFNENVQIDDAMNKVVVSPAQRNAPSVTASGHRVTVELRDTLLPNTTYTIDFSDAIKDLNEGNVLDGFAIDFSTGPTIDTLRISGMVFEAATLEPAQGMLVGAYLDRGDSAITSLPFDRITKTNQLGQFTLRNLRPGSYRVYAVKDNNRDYHWDRSEDIAFLDSLITPTAERITVTDSLRSASGADSIVSRTATRYQPNDVILCWFNETYLAQYLKEYNRPDRRRLTFTLGAPTDTLPLMRIINGPFAGDTLSRHAVLQTNNTLDSLVYWLRTPEVVAQDTLLVETTYQRLDSTEHLIWKTDTLRLNFRDRAPKKGSANKKKKKADSDTTATDTVPHIEFIKISLSSGGTADLDKPMVLTSLTPIESIDSLGVRMEMLEDTVWIPVAPPRFRFAGPRSTMQLIADYDWKPATKYKLTVDSAAVTDIYGLHNSPIKQEIMSRAESDYSALYFMVSGLSGRHAVVELLNGSDKPVATAPVINGEARLLYLTPGTYYARLYLDDNDNSRWDHGMLSVDSLRCQPEEVYYYPRALKLKKNWDVEQTWNIYDTPLDRQKPEAIKKNKPAERNVPGTPGKKAGKRPGDDDEDDDADDFNNNPYSNNYNPFDPNSRNRDPNRLR